MDLLNSILNSMEPPPSNEQQKMQIKREKELIEKMQRKHKEEILRFRKYVEERIERFEKDENRAYIEFQPLDKVHRAVIHEIAENVGFLTLSFGREDIDRYSVVYKKENAPSEDELIARRNGDGWNEEVAKEYADIRKHQQELEIEQRKAAILSNQSSSSTENDIKPVNNYKDKYAHLIGQETAMQARKTETNVSYGFVPSKNKKDVRSIEQTLADIQAKKKLKLEQQQQNKDCEKEQSQQIISNPNQTEYNKSSDLPQN